LRSKGYFLQAQAKACACTGWKACATP